MNAALDPQAQRLLDRVAQSDVPPYQMLDARTARAYYEKACEAAAMPTPEPFSVTDIEVGGAEGKLPARCYRPSSAEGQPALVFFHGGGFTIGSPATHDVICRYLCVKADCVVLSVDYRLAPEHKYPAAIDDAFAALTWVFEHAESLAIDAERIAVAGDSAGGNLTAVSCLRARGQGGPQPCFQLLIYPDTDMTASLPSRETLGHDYLLTSDLIDWFHAHYLPEDSDTRDWRISPLHAPDHQGLPPTHVVIAGFDPLRDEGLAYANKLRAAGVPVTVKNYEGMLHGFLTQSRFVSEAEVALADCAEKLREAFL